MIIFSFFSRLCISSSSIRYSAKAIWESLDISMLSSGGIDITIATCHSWGELIYHLFITDFLLSIFDCQFWKVILLVLKQCGQGFVIIGGSSTPFGISVCAIDLIDGAQCKCEHKRWFLFYPFLWTCWETDYFRLSCELVGWLTIAKSQALEIFFRSHTGAVKGVVGESKSVNWGVSWTKGEMHKR